MKLISIVEFFLKKKNSFLLQFNNEDFQKYKGKKLRFICPKESEWFYYFDQNKNHKNKQMSWKQGKIKIKIENW